MKPMFRVACMGLMALTLVAAGCENISLVRREDPFARRDGDRNRDLARDRDLDRGRQDVVGTVQRVDRDRREFQLRNSDGDVEWFKYDASTRITGGDRDLRVEDLRYGDLVRVEFSTDRGGRYAEVIRVNDRSDLSLRR
jgi:hypothetical protein